MLTDVMNDYGLEPLVRFPTRENNTLDLILTSLPCQFHEIHSPDKLSDHDEISGTLKVHTHVPPPHPHHQKETSGKGVFVPKGKF